MSLSSSGTPRNGPSGSGPALSARAGVEALVDDGMHLGVHALDALDRGVHELERLHLTAADELGLIDRVEQGQIVDHERRR